jgi:hypothetical protein
MAGMSPISRPIGLLCAVLACGFPGASGVHAARKAPAQATALRNGAPSMDVLLAQFIDALAARDRNALRRLRVDEREYLDVVMPGSIEPGKERRRFPDEKAKYFWDVLNEKSTFGEIALLNNFGGRKFTVQGVDWAKGVRQFDGYKGYAQLRLTVRDETGAAHEIDTGSVAEIGGRYKFVSYIRD